MKTSSRAFARHPSIFHTLRSAFYKKKVAHAVRELMARFGDSAWLEASRRQLAARTPTQIDLWRDVASAIVLKVRAARDAGGQKTATHALDRDQLS